MLKGITHHKKLCVAMSLAVLCGVAPNIHAATAKDKGTAGVQSWVGELEKQTPNTSTAMPVSVEQTNANVPAIFPLNPNKPLNKQDSEKIITVDFYKTDIHNVFRLLGEVSGKNIVVDEEVAGNLTLALQEVPWPFVLEIVKSLKDLKSIEQNNTIMIYPSKKEVTWSQAQAGEEQLEVKDNEQLDVKAQKELDVAAPEKPELLVAKAEGMLQTSIEDVVKAQELLEQAVHKEKQGDFKLALSLYSKSSEIWVENTQLVKKIASLALAVSGEEMTVLNVVKRGLRFAKDDAELSMFAAIAASRLNRSDEAKLYFDKAASAKTATPHILYNYAVFCNNAGYYDDALRAINKLEMAGTTSPHALVLKAMVYERLNNVNLAAKCYQQVIQSDSVPKALAEQAMFRLNALGVEHKKVN